MAAGAGGGSGDMRRAEWSWWERKPRGGTKDRLLRARKGERRWPRRWCGVQVAGGQRPLRAWREEWEGRVWG
ncbi:hypothetical protein E2562_000191 [Oryza meyeriana var. granulata]|uniref:Uncharacterized protein n=1 Tax=Oryza meyeriana var. granulata TaxID=110450 RepID=A0A6G1DBS2_9ORYZ|nr:hypothetical protein E2562_000191 [Oryza meyeriana var. granulata]